jgi:hypothetical protein
VRMELAAPLFANYGYEVRASRVTVVNVVIICVSLCL